MDDFNRAFPFGVAFAMMFAGFIFAMIALHVWAYWRIFSRAGHPGALALLMLVPLVNVGMILFLAFGDWPVLREMEALRRRVGGGVEGAYPG